MTCSRSEPFADWLDVTCPPDSSFADDVHLFFDRLLCPVRFSDPDRVGIDVGDGLLVIERKARFHRVSLSGSGLAYLRENSCLQEYLSVLGGYPHKVTRLDLAVDLLCDAPPILRGLEDRYPNDLVPLSRKNSRVTRMYSARPSDGAQTGTWYVGHRSSARVTARVYDKQAEVFSRTGELVPPRTRFELTFRKDQGCTLRDVAMPQSLYYQYASPALLSAPEGVSAWSPHAEGWAGEKMPVRLPYEVFKRRVENSPELLRLAELASQFGDEGAALILRTFNDRLTSAIRDSHSSEMEPTQLCKVDLRSGSTLHRPLAVGRGGGSGE